MIYTILLTILVIDCFLVVGAILAQSGKGGGLAASFGGASSSPDALIGVRQAGNLLTKISWWGGAVFLGLAFVLQIMSTRKRAPRSVLEKALSTQPINAAPPPTATPAVPLEPANPAPTTVPATRTPTPPASTPQR